jgi:hypothetical protein
VGDRLMTIRIVMGLRLDVRCIYCKRNPEEIPDCVDNPEQDPDPTHFVIENEGTFNHGNGHFACTDCYIAIGMPASPRGWRAPWTCHHAQSLRLRRSSRAGQPTVMTAGSWSYSTQGLEVITMDLLTRLWLAVHKHSLEGCQACLELVKEGGDNHGERGNVNHSHRAEDHA